MYSGGQPIIRLDRRGVDAALLALAEHLGRSSSEAVELVVCCGAAYHLADLMALNPSPAEMLDAARWCLTQDASDAFPTLVHSFLEKTGYPDAAGRTETGD